jgi:hypothetical protein
MPLDLATVRIGDVFQMQLQTGSPEDSYFGMVTARYDDGSVGVRDIKLLAGDSNEPRNFGTTQVRREAQGLLVGRDIRCTMKPQPQFRRWADDPNALLSFVGDHPTVPTGLSLEQLVHFEESIFVLTNGSPQGQLGLEACFRVPFHDFISRKAIRQQVTVCQIVGEIPMERKQLGPESWQFRHIVPENAQFTPVAHGQMLEVRNGVLKLANGMTSRKTRIHLYDGRHFAVETRVLQQAGFITTAD